MKLYIKQRIFTIGDKFDVTDEQGIVKYKVHGEIFTFGKKLHVLDANGEELTYIKQQIITFLPKFYVYRNDVEVGIIKKEFTLFNQAYNISGLNWQVKGNFFAHDYQVYDSLGKQIITVHKAWISIGDVYEISIDEATDEINAISVVLAIDAVLEMAENNNN